MTDDRAAQRVPVACCRGGRGAKGAIDGMEGIGAVLLGIGRSLPLEAAGGRLHIHTCRSGRYTKVWRDRSRGPTYGSYDAIYMPSEFVLYVAPGFGSCPSVSRPAAPRCRRRGGGPSTWQLSCWQSTSRVAGIMAVERNAGWAIPICTRIRPTTSRSWQLYRAWLVFAVERHDRSEKRGWHKEVLVRGGRLQSS